MSSVNIIRVPETVLMQTHLFALIRREKTSCTAGKVQRCPALSFLSKIAAHSTCLVCGNISNGWISFTS